MRTAGAVGLFGPEARRVGRENLVDQDHAILDGTAVAVADGQQAELEFRVGDDDAARFGMRGAFGVEAQRQLPDAIEHALADQFGGVLFRDVDVVPALRLRRRREDRFGQPIRFTQSLGQADAAQLTGRDIVFPARARQVASGDAFHRQRLGAGDEHRPALQQIGRSPRFARIRGRRGRQEVIGHDRLHALEPERRNLGEHLALVGNARAEHIVERGDAVGGDDQQAIAELVDIADLTLAIGASVGECGLEYGNGERQKNPQR